LIGFHQETDSYTAEKWQTENDDKYPIKYRQLSSCCPNGNCKKENTGGYKLNSKDYTKSNDMIIYKDTKNTIQPTFGDDMFDKSPLFNLYEDKTTNFYVVGLAGDFCVKDTAINLKNNYPNSNVYVIQELTRYVFLPTFIGLERLKLINPENNGPCIFKETLLPRGEWLNNDGTKLSDDVFKVDDSNKALSSYMFKYDPLHASEIQRLNKTDLETYRGQDVTKELGLWHFGTDHRTLVKDYFYNGVIILKSKSEEQEQGGGKKRKGRVTKKQRKYKKNKHIGSHH
jgi:hypothetical protein